jgi:hypothetical protein
MALILVVAEPRFVLDAREGENAEARNSGRLLKLPEGMNARQAMFCC